LVEKKLVSLGQEVRAGDTLFLLGSTDPVYHFVPMEVRTPVSGVIRELPFTVGSRVEKGQKLASVIDPKQLCIEVEITTKDVPTIKKESSASLVLKEGKSTPLRLNGMSPFVDPLTGTAQAIYVPVNSKEFSGSVPGSVVQIRIESNKHSGVMIPEEAVQYRDNQTIVRVLGADSKISYRSLKLGSLKESSVEVLDGLKTGDRVVVRANTHLSEGEKVDTLTEDTKEKL
jgi:multidrug efflux system membrane fusion protein